MIKSMHRILRSTAFSRNFDKQVRVIEMHESFRVGPLRKNFSVLGNADLIKNDNIGNNVSEII